MPSHRNTDFPRVSFPAITRRTFTWAASFRCSAIDSKAPEGSPVNARHQPGASEEAVGTRKGVRLEDWLQHQFQGCLHHPVGHRRDPRRSLPPAFGIIRSRTLADGGSCGPSSLTAVRGPGAGRGRSGVRQSDTEPRSFALEAVRREAPCRRRAVRPPPLGPRGGPDEAGAKSDPGGSGDAR